MIYRIRPYCDDAEALAHLCHEAITVIGKHGYTTQQVSAWAARHPSADSYRKRAANGSIIWVAVDAHDTPVAYLLLEPDGHLDHLYNHPDHTRRRLAAQLLETAELNASNLGIARLYTEASELARPAFERAGYVVINRRNFDLPYEGSSVAIHNYAMEKQIG